MSDAAVPTIQPIAQFLAIGAPVAADAAVAGDFAALLAQQLVDASAPVVPEPGKILPVGRQDLAGLQLPAVTEAADPMHGDAIDTPIDGEAGAEEEDDAPADAVVPEALFPIFAMLSQPVPVRAEPVAAAPQPAPASSASSMPEQPAAIVADGRAGALPPVAAAAPKPAAAPIVAASAAGIVLPGMIADAIADPRAVRPAAVQPMLPAPPPAPAHSIAFTMRPAPAAMPVAAAPAAMSIVDAAPMPAGQGADAALPEPARDARPAEGKADIAIGEARPARFAAPVAPTDVFALQTDPAAEAMPRKARTTAGAGATPDVSAMPGAPSLEIRGVTAVAATNAVDPSARDRLVSLVDTIATLRSEGRGDALALSIKHDDFGPISVRFERTDDSVLVRFDTQDADLARLIADASPELKAMGEPHGMRFERRDPVAGGTGGAGADTDMGGSHDAPRQGRDPAFIRTGHRPPSSPTRDRGGIFA